MNYAMARLGEQSRGDAYSAWQDWSPPLSLGSFATGQPGYPALSGSEVFNLRNGTLFATLVGVGLSSGVGMALLVGSGGSSGYLVDYARREISTTSEATWGTLLADLAETRPSVTARADAPVAVFGAADLVAEIKSSLGVNVTELAAIARVSRQTIYGWIGEGQVSEANYERLRALREVCLDWRARVKRPVGRLLNAKNADGYSLFDLLGQEPLDRTAIGLQLEALAVKAVEQAGQRRKRNARLAPLSEKDQYENALTHGIPAADS